MLSKSDRFSYATRENLEYIENLYQNFRTNPETVSSEWRKFFEGVEFAKELSAESGLSSKELDVFRLINAYRDYGHFEANLNPLATGQKSFPELSLLNFNLSDDDLDTDFEIGAMIGMPGARLREIIRHLRDSYCGTITAQVSDAMPTVRNWLIREFEQGRNEFQLSPAQKIKIHGCLGRAESFDKFLHTRYVGKKRFSGEGCDSMFPMLEQLVDRGTELGMEELVIGMAHRGRLNVLVNFMGKAAETVFAEFEGIRDEHNSHFDGDVKYHIGYSADKKTPDGECHISLAFNPSHLEAVDPVVMGMVRAKQRRRRDTGERKKVIPLLIHGDAAVAGQGVVPETLQLSQLRGYSVGGTIHLITDNQVGFTANPESTRSSPYAADIAKILQTPVIFCNADDAESCVRAMDIAVRFRQEFKLDICVSLLGYRRFGHNEGDEPAFTQPLMYEKIKKHPTVYDIYSQKLVRDGVINDEEPEKVFKSEIERLQKVLDQTRKAPPAMKPMVFEGAWKSMRQAVPEDFAKETNTKTKRATLDEVAKVLTTFPAGFTPHPKLQKLIEGRIKMLDGDGLIDWGMAELLAYGTLMKEGAPIRISGQDSIRGTFSHRHSCWFDFVTGEMYSPLSSINPEDVEFCVYNSPLSEYAVLGFEYGNSSSDPSFLTIWEAQFGDFANGAQIIIDQFIASAEQKWLRMSGLTLLLPHGNEGQGPEHSSARLERFLQLCAQENMQVCNLTQPAQIFHALRRQVKRDFRKPLIIMSPKSTLRHPKMISTTVELTDGTFKEVIGDSAVDAKKVEVAVLCSGKIYFDLADERDKQGLKNLALIRVEQLYPFPEKKLASVLKSFSNLKTIVWAQEECKNMGAWPFMHYRWDEFMDTHDIDLRLNYVGRLEKASPATGSEKVHITEQKQVVADALAFASGKTKQRGKK